jgi:hypothetical protein
MKDYLLKLMQCLFYIKLLIAILWFILLFGSIGILLTCIVIGNSPQFHNVINYIAAAGVVGFMMSMAMLCLCPLISEKLGCNRRVINSYQPDIHRDQQNVNRESSSIIDNLIISKSENDFPIAAVAIYIQDNDQITYPSELPIAEDVSLV